MNGKYSIRLISACALAQTLMMTCPHAVGQPGTSTGAKESIRVVARVWEDSVALRWAPLTFDLWSSGNRYGYTIERYTIVRNNAALRSPEKIQLTPAPIRPYGEDQWRRVIEGSKYAAVAAQALLGETFDLDLQQTDAVAIVNKTRENDQRFSIGLYCADMSVVAARALGLYYIDRTVRKNEKYLYRITGTNSDGSTFRGSLVLSGDEPTQLWPPDNVTAEAEGRRVLIKWNVANAGPSYATYVVEKSVNGSPFTPISATSDVLLTPAGREIKYAIARDSLDRLPYTCLYRVRGVTVFEELGPPSEAVAVYASAPLTDIPFITSATSEDNVSVNVTWEFANKAEGSIKGFVVERAPAAGGTYRSLTQVPVDVRSRSFKDRSPDHTNYYRVAAVSKDDKQLRSFPYFVQLVDSLPPAPPDGLQGKIDTAGVVTVTWNRNPEPDLYGYRVYRSYNSDQEFAQVTVAPVADPGFSDTVSTRNLNAAVYYKIVAVDNSQNQSGVSATLSLQMPDLLPPMPPAFLPVKSTDAGVELSWYPSSSRDVRAYCLYRQADERSWTKVAAIPHTGDSVYHYSDKTVEANIPYKYRITAVDHGGLESEHLPPITATRIDATLRKAVTLEKTNVDRERNQAVIAWSYALPDVRFFQVYRQVDSQPLELYRTLTDTKLVEARLKVGVVYSYRIVAVFKNGSRSRLSEEIRFEF